MTKSKRSAERAVVRKPTPAEIEAVRSAIMGMLKPTRTPPRKITINELESMLNSEEPPSINILPDGTLEELTPRTTTASEIAEVACRAMLAAAKRGRK